jgi:hypothetical protein
VGANVGEEVGLTVGAVGAVVGEVGADFAIDCGFTSIASGICVVDFVEFGKFGVDTRAVIAFKKAEIATFPSALSR